MPPLGPYPEFSWSLSRHGLFETCRRKYYWQYYGSWQGWPTGTGGETAKTAYRLKQLTTPAMVVGDMVHNAIATILKQWAATEELPEETLIMRSLASSAERRARESREGAWEADPKRATHFFQDYYGEGLSAEEPGKIAAQAKEALNTFYAHFLPTIQTQPGRSCIVVDGDIGASKTTWEGTTVYVMPDLVWADGAKVYVYDWKTGRPREKDRLQLTGYACWLSDASPGEIEADFLFGRLAYLASGDSEEFPVDGEAMEGFRGVAMENIGNMLPLHEQVCEALGDPEACPMTEDVQICRWCNFKELCER